MSNPPNTPAESKASIFKKPPKGLGFLPNLLTLSNLFAGFLSILFAVSGLYTAATLAIFFGALCDILDGRVARMVKASSRFGAELDSLCDAVSFGVAPAILMFSWVHSVWIGASPEFVFSGTNLTMLTAAVSFLYVACAILRLARFNIQAYNGDSFLGLPSPAAAFVMLCFYHLGSFVIESYDVNLDVFFVVLLVLFALLSLSMISTITFFKTLPWQAHPVRRLVVFVLLLAVMILQPISAFFVPIFYWVGGFVWHFAKNTPWVQRRL